MKSDFKILILISKIKYSTINVIKTGHELKTPNENTLNKNPPKPNSAKAKKLLANIEVGNEGSLPSISREEMKREAIKPLYLDRYE